ncbi:MAG: hypothetical protein J6B30_05270 [Muribaculaceae bacterium]|nr:hypothetical protein [Muribaculaceae bacterium]
MAEIGTDSNAYIIEWAKMLTTMWQERIEMLGVVYTGQLHQSISDTVQSLNGGYNITMRFKRYGIYQSLGVGNGYTRGNGGDLQILDNTYREEHGLNKRRRVGPKPGGYLTSGKPRKRRDWISKKLFLSVMNLRDDLARIVGEEAALVVAEALTDLRDAIK